MKVSMLCQLQTSHISSVGISYFWLRRENTNIFHVCKGHNRDPTHTGKTGKPGKMREVFPVREKSGNFRISPESQGIFYQSGKSQGNFNQKKKLLFYGGSLKTVVCRYSFV